jgi:hypothetical protein
MRTVRCLSAVVLLSALPVSAAAARDVFVNNVDGDDAFDGRYAAYAARTGPVRSISRALELASPGDRIVLADTGVGYRESISLVGKRHSGSATRPFVIQGNGATLDGSAPVPPDAWENYHGPVFRFRPPYVAHQQLFLDGRPVARVFASPEADEPPPLRPLQWCLFESQVYFAVEPDACKLPEDYALSYAHRRVGITLLHVERVAIVDLVVQGFQLDGINAFNGARGVTIAGVTCRGNGRSGITVGGASQVRIDDSLSGDNGTAQLLTLPWSETAIRDTELLSNTAPGWVDEGGRVYLNGERVRGGLEEVVPGAAVRSGAQ